MQPIYCKNAALSAKSLQSGYVNKYAQERGTVELSFENGYYFAKMTLSNGHTYKVQHPSLSEVRKQFVKYCDIVGRVNSKGWPWVTAYAHLPS